MGYSLFTQKKYALDPQSFPAALNLLKKNLENIKKDKGSKYLKYDVKGIGRFLMVEAYYHEVDQYYNCVGFEVDIEYQFDFQKEPQRDVGFYSVWVGKSHSCAPITFETSYATMGQAHKFDNGCGDHCEITNILMTMEDVQKKLQEGKP